MDKIRLPLAASLLLTPLALPAQTAPSDARFDGARAGMMRTAEALGVPVYEDYPVYAGGAAAPAPAYTAVTRAPSFQLLPPPVPEPQPAAGPAETGNAMPMGNKWGYLRIAWHAVAGQLQDSGVLFWQEKAPSFDEISRGAEAAVRASAYAPRAAGQESLLRDEGFVRELEAVSGTKFIAGNAAEPLIDGPAAFAVKDRLIRGAKRSIYAASYAFYDDVTGQEAASMLIERRRAGVDVKVMVDDKMAGVFGGRQLKQMADAGIDVLRYSDADRPHDYLHVKLLVVDGEAAVAGGQNYGDPYSHKGGSLKWRDTDAVIYGPAAAEAARAFASLWNSSVKDASRRMTAPQEVPAAAGAARVAVVPQNPPSLNPPLLTSMLKAMAGATRRINIENAYIIAIPAVNRAVAEARARGVEVNILTNSKESIDSDGKSMADSIVEGTKVFLAAGANVYLKQGETLHSKFLTVDGEFATVGSYNLHPRSERYDTECNFNVLDPAFAAGLDEAFARDIAAAKKITLKDFEGKKPGLLSRLLLKVGFGQLSHKL
jgi:cardiolipin synthase